MEGKGAGWARAIRQKRGGAWRREGGGGGVAGFCASNIHAAAAAASWLVGTCHGILPRSQASWQRAAVIHPVAVVPTGAACGRSANVPAADVALCFFTLVFPALFCFVLFTR